MYTSTRSKMNINASKAIIDGIAPDGGLFVKKLEKKFSNDDLVKLSKLSYKELAFKIMKLFFNDFKEENLSALIDKAYTNTFDTENLVEVKSFAGKSDLFAQTLSQNLAVLHIKELILKRTASGIDNQNFHSLDRSFLRECVKKTKPRIY